jgi:hypothetical protein
MGLCVGEGRNTHAFRDFGMVYLARIEYMPLGDFKDSEGDLEVSKTPKLRVGVAYGFIAHASKDQGILGSAPADGGTTDFHNFDADFVFAGWACLRCAQSCDPRVVDDGAQRVRGWGQLLFRRSPAQAAG